MSDNRLNFVEKNGQIVFNVKVIPGSSKNIIAGVYNGMMKVRLAAPPEKGRANQAMIELFAEKFNISKSSIVIVSGLTAKIKQIALPSSPEILEILKSYES